MSSPYTDVVFNDRQPDSITAVKLNRLRDDLSTAIGSGGGGAGAGDMTKAVYDTNNNGKVDTCDSLAWTAVIGKPSTFPPDSTAMLKSVYDTNADNIVDHAALADTASWTGITGKPSTFPPNSGTWTTLSLGTGWTVKVTPQYRIEDSTGNATVFCRGAVTQASGAASLAFTFPVGVRPPAIRMMMLAGLQTEGQTLYHAQIDTSGNVTVTPVVRAVFTWPATSTAQDVYLDSLTFSL